MYLWKAYENVIDFDDFLEYNIDTSIPEEYFELLFGHIEDYREYVSESTYHLLLNVSKISRSLPLQLFIFYSAMYLENKVDEKELIDYFHSQDLGNLLDYLYILTSIGGKLENEANFVRKEVVVRYNNFDLLIEKLVAVDEVFAKKPSCILSELVGKDKYLDKLKTLSLLKLSILLGDRCYFVETMDIFIEKALNLYTLPSYIADYLGGILSGNIYIDKYERLFNQLDFGKIDNTRLLKLYWPYNRPIVLSKEVERRLEENLFDKNQLIELYLSPNTENKKSLIYKLIEKYVEISEVFDKSSNKKELVTIYAQETFHDKKRFLGIYNWLLIRQYDNWIANIFSNYALEHGDKKLKLEIMNIWLAYGKNSSTTMPSFDADVFEYLLVNNKNILRLYISTALTNNNDNYDKLASIVSTIGNRYDYSTLVGHRLQKTINYILNEQV